jgi:cell division protease FtsH
MKQAQKSTAFLLFIILLGLLFMALVNTGEVTQKPSFAEFLQAVDEGRVDSEDLVVTAGENDVDEISGRFSDLTAPVDGTVEVDKAADPRALKVTVRPADGAAPIEYEVSKKIYGARLARWRPTGGEGAQTGCAGAVTSESGAKVKKGDLIARGPKFQTRGRTKQYVSVLEEGQLVPDFREGKGRWGGPMTMWLPVVIVLVFVVFLMRQLQVGGGKAMQFGKSRARLLNESGTRITFADVAGVEEAKEELEEIVQFLASPKKVTRLGGRIPKGVLLMGPPGTGKTLLARAIAGEAGVPFFSISGSDFVEMFVGVGASRVRDLFEQGKKNAPCIIFIDEIDAVGRQRGAGLGGGHDEREQTLNQLLVEMDGFESNEGVILIAATNRPDVLDPALLRPGRFDRRVVVPRPDIRGREQILNIHAREIPLAEEVDLAVIARGTPGFTGADLANLMNEAALLAAREDHNAVGMNALERAKDKVMMGAERRSLVMSDDEKRDTAYHEAGHALVAAYIPDADPIHRVTIVPRGQALGLTQQLPEAERFSHDHKRLLNNIKILMGGRAAEEVALEKFTTGASNDIERATDIARRMVCEWGMSEMGPLAFGKKEEQIFLGREFAQHQDYSEATAIEIDAQVREIVTDGYAAAKRILLDNLDALHDLAARLLEVETVSGEDVHRVLNSYQTPTPA